MIGAALDLFGRHATWFLALGAVAGMLSPALADLAHPIVVPGLMLPLVIALIRLDWSAAAAYRRRPLLVLAMLVWILIVLPVTVGLLVRILPMPPALREAVVLGTASSPVISAIAIAFLVGLDAALIVVLVVLATAVVPLTLPALARVLLGVELGFEVGTFMLRLVLLVGGAFALAGLVRAFVPARWIEARATLLDGVSVVTLVAVAVGIMQGVNRFAHEHTAYVIAATFAAFAANVAMQAVSALFFWRFGRQIALGMALTSGNRNLGLVLVALQGQVGMETLVYFAVAQLPMCILPALQKPVYRRVLGPGALGNPIESRVK